MKRWILIGSAAALAVTLTGCAHQAADSSKPAIGSDYAIAGPAVKGTVNIKQRVALPADAVLTVSLSDISLADSPSRVITQSAVRTEGKQAPFDFVLPFDPAQIKANARIIASAAITVDGRLLFVTDSINEVINHNGTQVNLQLVPVQSTAIPLTATTTP